MNQSIQKGNYSGDQTLQNALAYWRSDHGYKNINNYLSIAIHGVSKYRDLPLYVELELSQKYAAIINNHMSPISEYKTMFRGDKELAGRFNHRREGFISLTNDPEQAASFVDDDCCVYHITINPDIRQIKTGIEGEIIVEAGCYWENLGPIGRDYHVLLHSPQWIPMGEYPWYGDVQSILESKSMDVYEQAVKILDGLLDDLEGIIDVDLELFLINTRRVDIPDDIAMKVWNK